MASPCPTAMKKGWTARISRDRRDRAASGGAKGKPRNRSLIENWSVFPPVPYAILSYCIDSLIIPCTYINVFRQVKI